MSNCNSLSCTRRSSWWGCQNGFGATCGTNHCSNYCGCRAGDGTPPCNPCAPWGRTNGDFTCNCSRCNHWNNCGNWGCGAVMGDTTCNSCGNYPCTCGNSSCCNWNCGNSGSSGCLIPRYHAIGRTFQRRITQTLCVDDIPDCAESPLTLVAVSVSGQASWEQISECRQQLLRVTVPVAVQIRDCSGRCRTGHSTVVLTIPLCGCAQQDFWRGQLYVAPCIRLAAPVTENEEGCFDATLEVQAEVYLVRLQATNC